MIVCVEDPALLRLQSQFVTAATLTSGAEQTFDIDLKPEDFLVGDVTCSVALSFRDIVDNLVGPRERIVTDSVHLTVLPASDGSTTSTATTSTTSP